MTVVGFRDQFPEFARATDAQVGQALTASSFLSARPASALPFAAAHLLAIQLERTGEPDGGSGEVKSESLAGAAMGTMPMAESGSDTFWTTSPYGRMVLALRMSDPATRIGVAVGGWRR